MKNFILWPVLVLLVGVSSTLNAASFKVEVDPDVAPLMKSFDIDFYKLQGRLTRFLDKNLSFDYELLIKVYSGKETYIDAEHNVAYVSVDAIARMRESINSRYPTQETVREVLLESAVEQVYWQQVIRLLVSALELPIEGEEAFVLDGFVTLMQLEVYETPFILDATEEILKVDQFFPVFSADAYASESEFDRARYHHITCLVLGSDYGSYEGEFSALSWGQERLKACQTRYEQELERWRTSLEPYLKENSPLKS